MGNDTQVVEAEPSAPGPEAAGEDGAARRDRLVFRAALATAALPFAVIAVALVVTVGGSYHPAGDLAMTELHVRDIGHHEVLTGLHSRWDWSHPGPLQFYVSAPIYWLSGSS